VAGKNPVSGSHQRHATSGSSGIVSIPSAGTTSQNNKNHPIKGIDGGPAGSILPDIPTKQDNDFRAIQVSRI